MKNHYIQAVIELLKSGKNAKTVFSGLKKTLERKGHTQLHLSILHGVEKAVNRKSYEPIVTAATKKTFRTDKKEIKKTLSILGADTTYEKKIDETLIGGYVAAHNHMMLDKSYKTKLTNLYRSITK